MIVYTDSLEGITADALRGGFFVGWPNPPSAETHLRLLKGSTHVFLALDDVTGNVVGFVTAINDGVTCAYIPHLEVLSPYQAHSVGTELMGRMLETVRHLYMIDLLCDTDVQPFYVRLGMHPTAGMAVRNYERQSGS